MAVAAYEHMSLKKEHIRIMTLQKTTSKLKIVHFYELFEEMEQNERIIWDLENCSFSSSPFLTLSLLFYPQKINYVPFVPSQIA
jgi:hypothetical protein